MIAGETVQNGIHYNMLNEYGGRIYVKVHLLKKTQIPCLSFNIPAVQISYVLNEGSRYDWWLQELWRSFGGTAKGMVDSSKPPVNDALKGIVAEEYIPGASRSLGIL